MPSPNGYFSDFSYTIHDRQSFRVTVDHDIDSAPWLPGQAGSYTLVWETGPTAAGPWTAAPLTDLGVGCTPQPDNETTVGGATSTLVRIGDPTPGTGTTADTDYFVRLTLLDPGDVQVDQWVLDTPAHTEAYPTFTCLAPNTTQTTADVGLGGTTGQANVTAPCNQDTVTWEIATTPGGPYTAAPPEAVTGFSPGHTFTGLTAGTTYYYRARFAEQAQTGGEYLTTQECSFTTEEAQVTVPPFNPQPCAGGGAGADAVDVEQIVLCDLDAEGNLLGTALAVYEYDTEGNPTGAPTFVDPATGDPYVPQGTLQPCPDAACLPPMQFCQTSTSTGPVEHPGRQYDITLPINPGFAVQSLQVDAVNNPAGITWEVDDPDGEAFRQNLTTFIEGRVPAAATVTITNPNAGVPQVCGAAQPMTVHIECLRLDQAPPNLIELVYNGGQDLIQNPAYNEFPALDPPVSQGNYGFRLLSREDDPGPFPGFPPSGDALCTSVANRGWETNDSGRTFEIWGQDVSNGQNTTPTPRGTPVQEITSDGPPPGGRSTIWQTFQAPASGNFIIRVVHGARDPGEQHRITLDNGDTDDTQNGDLIDDISNPPSVTSSGGPNPWTQFSQTIPLNGGSTYTLALSTNNPVAGARGGLFTDMRAYIDRPDQRATAATDDDTCVVTTEETTTNTICSYWQPQCAGGAVVGWQKVDTGETMTNAEFWAQVPTPSCCLPEASEGGSSSGQSNMLTSDLVCATVGGIPQNAIRMVVTDPSGGTLQVLFLGTDGAPIAPDTWTAGPCTTSRYMADQVLCDDNGPFLRKYVQSLDATNQAQVNSFRDFTLAGVAYVPVGDVGNCPECVPIVLGEVCVISDETPGVVLTATAVQACDGTVTYLNATTGEPWSGTITVVVCPPENQTWEEILCDAGNGGQQFRRIYNLTPLGSVTLYDEDLDANPYAPVGPVVRCSDAAGAELDLSESLWCVGGLPAIRHVVRNETAATETVTWLRSDGTVFVPTAPQLSAAFPGSCTTPITDLDFFVLELCDNNGAFLRRLTFNSTTGAVTTTTNTTLAGAAYVPVGTVGICDGCCPAVVGNGCTNTGSGFYTAIRATNGTITLIDSVTGAAVLAGNIVPCPSDDTTRTLTAQARLVGDADAPWTPGADVAGTLTSVTMTVLTGTATLTDQNGTVLAGLPAGFTATWSVEDDNTLSGPTSIDAVGGSTVVHWTQR